MNKLERRYDIDWLRVIAIGLLLIYHIGIGFQPWGVFIRFIQNDTPLESLWVPMSMLNVWRIPLLFYVSGMGVCFALRKRNLLELIMERSRRILIPFLFGVFCIVPLHLFIWQDYYRQDLTYSPGMVHLWFLANLFIYVLILASLIFLLRKLKSVRFEQTLSKILSSPFVFLFIFAVFIAEAELLRPETFELYATTLHGFLLGLLAFIFGFLFIQAGDAIWTNLRKFRWLFLLLAVSLFLARLNLYELKAPYFLMSIESNSWIFALFGFANIYLQRSTKVLTYLSQAAYPVYIIHMVFLYAIAYFIFPLNISVALKFFISVIGTGMACFLSYEFIIRRIRFLRPLFGLKIDKKKSKEHTVANLRKSA